MSSNPSSLKPLKRKLPSVAAPEQHLFQRSLDPVAEVDFVPVIRIHENVSQETMRITKDRMRLYLLKHLRRIKHRKDWRNRLSLPIALAIALATSNFDALSWINPELVRAGFLLMLVYFTHQTYMAWRDAREIEEPEEAVDTIIAQVSDV